MRERTTHEEPEQLRAIFEAAADTPYSGHEGEWEARAERIGLPASYAPAVCEAVRQGRWRKAKNWVAYVRRVAQREAGKMGAVPDPEPVRLSDLPVLRDDDGRPLSHDEHLDHLCWKYAENGNEDDEPSLLDRVDESFLNSEDDEPDAPLHIDWDKAVRRVGLDKGQRRILAGLRKGLTRDEILQGAKTDAERRGLEAAWQRFISRGVPAMRKTLFGANSTT